MKHLLFLLIMMIVITNCATTKSSMADNSTSVSFENDSTGYDLIVLDPQFDTFIQVEARPINFYSNEYYQAWNVRYTNEWNSRHNNPSRYGTFYSTYIDYSPTIDYGIELNYKLYNYFLYIEKKYNIVLIRRGRAF